jgi:hypothetical protein
MQKLLAAADDESQYETAEKAVIESLLGLHL